MEMSNLIFFAYGKGIKDKKIKSEKHIRIFSYD